jgi:hypothetical protein
MRSQKLLNVSKFPSECLLALALYSFAVVGRLFAADTNTPALKTIDWTTVQSTNWKIYVTNLRATGCPEDVVGDIIFSEVNKTYAARWRTMNGDDAGKYWVSKREGWWGHTKQKQFNALEREKKELIRELLGADADVLLRKYLVLNYDVSSESDLRLDFLTVERKQKLTEVLDKDDREIQMVWLKQEPGGGLPAVAQHELNVAMQQRKDDLAKTLSALELEEYEVRNSPLAKDLRRQLYGFEATEPEFRDIFRAQKAMRDQFADLPYNSTDEKTNQRRVVAAEAMENKIRSALGEKRYADYLRTKSADYQELLNFADEFELPKETASRAYDTIKRAKDRLKLLEGDTGMSNAERLKGVDAVQAQTDEELTKLLGEKGLKYYKQNYGDWTPGMGKTR